MDRMNSIPVETDMPPSSSAGRIRNLKHTSIYPAENIHPWKTGRQKCSRDEETLTFGFEVDNGDNAVENKSKCSPNSVFMA